MARTIVRLAAAATATFLACTQAPPPPPPPPPPLPPPGSPVIAAINPASASFGAKIELSGNNLPATREGAVLVFHVGERSINARILESSATSLTAIVPVAFATTAQVRVWSGALHSLPRSFAVTAPTDSTPAIAGDEVEAKLGLLAELFAAVESEMDLALYPALASIGREAEATKIQKLLADLRGFSGEYANAVKTQRPAPAVSGADGVLDSELFAQFDRDLVEAIRLLGGATLGDALRGTSEARALLEGVENELAAAIDLMRSGQGLANSLGEVPSVAFLQVAIDTTETALSMVHAIVAVLGTAPASPVADSFRIAEYEPERHLNQHFAKDPHARSRAAVEPAPGVAIIPLEYVMRGQIDFEGRSDGVKRLINEDLPPGVKEIVAGAGAIDLPNLEAEDVDIALALESCDNAAPEPGASSPCVENGVITGVWGPTGLTVAGVLEGRTSFVRVYPDLVEVQDECPELGASSCILKSEVMIHREMKVLPAPILTAISPAAAHVGDRVSVTGEGLPSVATEQLNIYFSSAERRAETIYALDFEGYEVEVPDASSGLHWFAIDGVESNRMAFEVLAPILEDVHPSALAGETYPFTGRGFSHTLANNAVTIGGEVVVPIAPEASEEAHHKLVIAVPANAQGTGLSVSVLGELATETEPVVVRSFSAPVTVSNPSSSGLRPALARGEGGRELIAWIEGGRTRGENMIVASTRDTGDGAWATPVVVATDVGGIGTAPPRPAVAVAVDRYHLAYVAVEDGRDVIRHVYSIDGELWSTPMTISSAAGSALQPAIAAGSGGLVAVAWIQEALVEGDPAVLAFRRAPSGGAFDPVVELERLGDVSDPALAATGDDVVLAWSEEALSAGPAPAAPARAIFAELSGDRGASIGTSAPVALSEPGDFALRPVAVILPSGSCAHRVYLAWESMAPHSIGFARWSGGPATDGTLVFGGVLEQNQFPALGVDGDCTPTLSWTGIGWAAGRSRTEPWQSGLYLARSFDEGLSFNPPLVILARDGRRVAQTQLGATDSGLITVAWQEELSDGSSSIVEVTTDGAPAAPAAHPENNAPASRTEWIFRNYSATAPASPADLSADVYVSLRDGSRLMRLTREGRAAVARPDISSDGRWLAFGGGIGPGPRIAEADGTHPLRIVQDRDGVITTHGAWIPDSPRLCYYDPSPHNIDRSGRGGSRPGCSLSPVPPPLPPGVLSATPSPDGAWMAVISGASGEFGRLGVADPAFVSIAPLTAGLNATHPVWSQDGTSIAFISNRDGRRQLYVTSPQSHIGEERRISTDLRDDYGPEFLADGSILVRTVDPTGLGELRVIDPATSLFSMLGATGYVSAGDQLTLDGFDFSVAVAPLGLNIQQGASGSVSVSSESGNIAIALSLEGAPPGVAHQFTPATIGPGVTSTLELTVAADVPPGSIPLLVRATGPDRARTAAFALTIDPAGVGP